MSRFDPYDQSYSLQSPSDVPTMQNPYASPEYVGPEPPPGQAFMSGRPEEPVPTCVKLWDILEQTWGIYSVNKWNSAVGVFGTNILAGIAAMALQKLTILLFFSGVYPIHPAVIYVYWMLLASICCFFTVGMFRLLTGLARREGRREAYFFSGGDTLWQSLLYSVIVIMILGILMLAVILIAMFVGPPAVAITPTGEEIPIPISIVLVQWIGIPVSLLWVLCTLPGYWLIADRRMNPFSALGLSLRMVLHNLIPIGFLVLWCAMVFTAGVLMFFFGLLWAIPYIWMHIIVFCMMASGERLAKIQDVE